MTVSDAVVAALIGLVAGVLSGLFGVGGGIVMTPGIQVLLRAEPIVALATPLPVILPTALTGAFTYRRAGEVDVRAAAWIVLAGLPASAIGAQTAEVVDTHVLLIVTAVLLAWQAVGILRDARRTTRATEPRRSSVPALASIGVAAGFVSGLLGIGGGIVMVPLMAGWLAMPLKRALGTSLAAIVALVVPGTVVHALNGNVDWSIFAALTVGAVPGARIGASVALGTRERTLRLLVGSFLLIVALAYGADEVATLFDR
jgi:uncharacterized membrane protein YfcA